MTKGSLLKKVLRLELHSCAFSITSLYPAQVCTGSGAYSRDAALKLGLDPGLDTNSSKGRRQTHLYTLGAISFSQPTYWFVFMKGVKLEKTQGKKNPGRHEENVYRNIMKLKRIWRDIRAATLLTSDPGLRRAFTRCVSYLGYASLKITCRFILHWQMLLSKGYSWAVEG